MLRRVASRHWTPAFAARFVTIIPIAMPALSPTMQAGTVVSWSKKVGDAVVPGDEMAKIETDKSVASFDNTAEEGFMARVLVQGGEADVPIGKIVCLLVEDKADVESEEVKNWQPSGSASKPAAAKKAEEPEKKAAESKPAPSSSSSASSSAGSKRSSGDRVFASPLARMTAKELGVDLSTVTGTGGSVGRVTKDDVVKASKDPKSASSAPSVKSGSPAAPAAEKKADNASVDKAAPAGAAEEAFERIPVSNMRRTIASRLTQSKNVEVPHYYLMQECKVDSMLAVIKQLNAKGKGELKITVNDYVIKAIARANLLVPECNTQWHGDHMRRFSTVDVSVAVATPTGLITPIVKDAHAKGLAQISSEVKALAKQAKEGTLAPEQYQGGTVSVSNMGGMGIDGFTAIINPPQSMILAVGTTLPKPEMNENEAGEFELTGKVEKVINFTASFDHRVVDGAIGAKWFKHFKDAIENPLSLLL